MCPPIDTEWSRVDKCPWRRSATLEGSMESESKQAAPWPLDALEGAKMILEVYQALILSGAYSGDLSAPGDEEILDEAESVVKSALARSRKNCKDGPMGQFFEQGAIMPGQGFPAGGKP